MALLAAASAGSAAAAASAGFSLVPLLYDSDEFTSVSCCFLLDVMRTEVAVCMQVQDRVLARRGHCEMYNEVRTRKGLRPLVFDVAKIEKVSEELHRSCTQMAAGREFARVRGQICVVQSRISGCGPD
jgi:hypothetical protein